MTKFIGFQPIFFDAILQKGTGATCMAAPMFGFKIPPELSFQSIYSSLVRQRSRPLRGLQVGLHYVYIM